MHLTKVTHSTAHRILTHKFGMIKMMLDSLKVCLILVVVVWSKELQIAICTFAGYCFW